MSWLQALSGTEFLLVAFGIGLACSAVLFALLFAGLLAYCRWGTEGNDGVVSELREGNPVGAHDRERADPDRSRAAL